MYISEQQLSQRRFQREPPLNVKLILSIQGAPEPTALQSLRQYTLPPPIFLVDIIRSNNCIHVGSRDMVSDTVGAVSLYAALAVDGTVLSTT